MTISYVPRQPPFSEVLISPIAQKAAWRISVDHTQLWVVAIRILLSHTKVAIMLSNTQPVIIENIIRFSGLGLSQREMSRNTRVSQGII